MTRTGAVIMIAGALTLGGCGSSSKTYTSAADLAKAAGCTGYAKQDPEMYVQEEGSCQIDGKDVYVVTFADATALDHWTTVAKAAGGAGYTGAGSTWAIYGDDKAAVEKGAKAAGGELK